MKKLQVVFIALFFVLLALPLAFFNWEENVVSEIDNRQLTNNPFGPNAEPGRGPDRFAGELCAGPHRFSR